MVKITVESMDPKSKNKKRKGFLKTVSVSILAVFAVLMLMTNMSWAEQTTAEDYVKVSDTIKKYCQYWMLKEYHKMFSFLAPETQESSSVLGFMKYYESLDRKGLDVSHHTIFLINDLGGTISAVVRLDFWDRHQKKPETKMYIFNFVRGYQKWQLAQGPVESDLPGSVRASVKEIEKMLGSIR